MNRILAFVRRDALVAASYRTGMVLSLGSLLTLVVPLYFIATALQPVIGHSIQAEGGAYFAFVIIGMASYQFVATAVGAIPMALGTGIRTGTFEALLVTPTRLPLLLIGVMGYPFLWTVARGLVLLVAGQILGAQFSLDRILVAVLIWGGITIAYVPFGILAGALVLLARTAGPLPNAVLLASMFLGGVYYPTHVIPSWLHTLSAALPLTYGLRALRKVLSTETPVANVAADLGMLLLLACGLLLASMLVFHYALRQAYRAGSLAQY
ncbi:MAG: ABC transporter permease [Gemmatimonadaceae bacterium]